MILEVVSSLPITIEGVAVAFSGVVLLGFWKDQQKQWRTQGENWEATRTWQARVDTALFGATGDNGINGTVKDHEGRIRRLEDA